MVRWCMGVTNLCALRVARRIQVPDLRQGMTKGLEGVRMNGTGLLSHSFQEGNKHPGA